ncbi:hypothetical protein NDU88_003821 [Pleurodeles waltl]|uniref:Uncharacterized protein n=1 Tax=Pleurodeles waltl TaxID=8319 RepID=A0AAV7VHY6_PLEWA|nr:hypothetical protein NDU88_003821 [Pleurodeles waltl]
MRPPSWFLGVTELVRIFFLLTRSGVLPLLCFLLGGPLVLGPPLVPGLFKARFCSGPVLGPQSRSTRAASSAAGHSPSKARLACRSSPMVLHPGLGFLSLGSSVVCQYLKDL